MMCRNLSLDLADVAPGMVLSGAILDCHGETLIHGGAEITVTMLAWFREHGIDRVTVRYIPVSEAELAAEKERLQHRLSLLFRNCLDQAASNDLFRSVTTYRMGERQ